MCGIVGLINSNNDYRDAIDKKALLTSALFADTVRGWDSTGVAFVTDNLVSTYKRAVNGADFIQLKTYNKLLSNTASSNFIMGHNRAATAGSINDETAHPFTEGHITGIHNGTLTSWRHLVPRNITVDSQALYKHMSEHGYEKTLKSITGAFALVWHDASDGTLNMIRNAERPLYLLKLSGTIGSNLWLYGSELDMLRWLALRHGFDIDDVKELEVGKMLTFNTEDTSTYTTKEVAFKPIKLIQQRTHKHNSKQRSLFLEDKFKIVTGEEILFTPTGWNMYGRSNGKDSNGALTGTYGATTGTVYVHGVAKGVYDRIVKENYITCSVEVSGGYYDSRTKEDVIYAGSNTLVVGVINKEKEDKDKTMVLGPHNTYISTDAFDKLTKFGCDMCGGNVLHEEAENIQWTFDGHPICHLCTVSYNLDGVLE